MNGEVSVNEVNSDVKSLGEQFELRVDTDQPVDQDGPDIFVDVSLPFHIEPVWHRCVFGRLHVGLDFCAVLTYMVDVRQRGLVHLVDVGDDVLLDAVVVHLKLHVEADLGEFLSGPQAGVVSWKRAVDIYRVLILLEVQSIQTLLNCILRI